MVKSLQHRRLRFDPWIGKTSSHMHAVLSYLARIIIIILIVIFNTQDVKLHPGARHYTKYFQHTVSRIVIYLILAVLGLH